MNTFKVTKKVREDYEGMIDTVVENNEFVILDLETTTLSPQHGGRIVEIGAVKMKDGEIIDTFSTLINPEMDIPKSSVKVHGITNEMVKDAPIYQLVLPEFFKFVGNLPIVGHNVSYDWDRFLLYYFGRLGIYPENKTVDTLVLSKVVLPAKEGDLMNLGAVCERCGIELENAHRAIHDAIATAKVFKIAKKRVEENNPLQPDLFGMMEYMEEKKEVEDKPVRQPILYANLWEKDFKDKSFRRIYVGLPSSKVFYDLIDGYWQVKETSVKVDFEIIEKDLINYLKRYNEVLLNKFLEVSQKEKEEMDFSLSS